MFKNSINDKISLNKILANKILYLCIITDISFIFLHGIQTFFNIDNPLLEISTDRGYAEIFQYIKEYWIIWLLLVLAFKTRSVIYIVWSGLFTYLLLDDSLEIHENFGSFFKQTLSFPRLFGIGTQHIGELVISVAVGATFLILLLITYRLAYSSARQISKFLIYLLFALALVGVVIDTLHTVMNSFWLNRLFTLVEDGGEMIVMSIILSFLCLVMDVIKPEQIKNEDAE